MQIKLKRLDKPKRKSTAHQISSLGVQNDHVQEQAENDVVVENSILLEEQVVNTTSTQPSIHLEDEEVHSFGGEWRDRWRLDRSGNGNHAKEKKKAKRRRNRTNRKLGGDRMKKVEPETVAVMFVEHTGNGELAKRLQKAEDEMSKTTGFRIRITEMAGSQLRRILPNTNPWHGSDCGRAGCGQGGERLEDCRRCNILYESSCLECNQTDTLYKKGANLGDCEGVYVGESGRSLHERAGEHHQCQ